MKRSFFLVLGVLIMFPCIAFAPMMTPDKKIMSNACVLSYTDTHGIASIVIRGNPITVFLK